MSRTALLVVVVIVTADGYTAGARMINARIAAKVINDGDTGVPEFV